MGRGAFSKAQRMMNRKVEQGKGMSCSFGKEGSRFDHKKGHRITKAQAKKLIEARTIHNVSGHQPLVAGKPLRKEEVLRIMPRASTN